MPTWFKSVSYGVYVIFIQFLGALGPLLTGVLSDAIGLVNALLCMQIFFVTGVMIIFLGSTFYLKDYRKARAEEAMAGCEKCPV